MRRIRRFRQVSLLVAVGTLLLGCEVDGGISAPDGLRPQFVKGGGNGGGGTTLVADFVIGDSGIGAALESPADCPGAVSTAGWHMDWGSPGCWTIDAPSLEYPLMDDIFIGVDKEPGKNGRITRIRFRAQDAPGPDGIQHDTDWLDVDPVVPSKNGYTLHMHAADAPIWKYFGHTVDTGRDRIIGTLSFGDIVVRAQ